MPSPQGIRAGRAFVEVGTYLDPLTKGLNAAAQKLSAFGQRVTTLGRGMMRYATAAAAPLAASSGVYLKAGDDMAKMSQRTGASVEALSGLTYAAEQSGANVETLEGGLRKMQKTLDEAGQGSKAATEALRRLGLTADDLTGRSPEKQFMAIADRLAKVEDPAQRAAMAMEIFGKSGTQLLPMMADGAKGIQALTDRAKDLGLIMSSDDANAAVTLGDTLADVWKVVKAGAFSIGAALQPALQGLAETTLEYLATAAKWIRENRGLVVTIATATAGVFALGAAFVAVGSILGTLGAAMAGIATFVAVVGTAISEVAAAVATPVGAIAVAALAIGGYFAYTSGTLGKVAAAIKGAFQTVKSDASSAFEGIKAAMAAGDFKQAATIVWNFIKLEWTRGTTWLAEKWATIKAFAQDTWDSMLFGALDLWEAIKAKWNTAIAMVLTALEPLAPAWEAAVEEISSAWQTATEFVTEAWETVSGYFEYAWENLRSGWAQLVSYFVGDWESGNKDIMQTWLDTQTWLGKQYLKLSQALGFDGEFDAEDASQNLDEDTKRRYNAYQAKKVKIEADAKTAKAEIASARSTREAERSAERAAEAFERAMNLEAAKITLQVSVDKATAEDSSQAAADQFAAAMDEEAAKNKDRPTSEQEYADAFAASMDQEAVKIAALPDVTATTKDTSVAGTFSAFALGGLGMGSAAEQTATNTRLMNERLKSIDRKLPGLHFV